MRACQDSYDFWIPSEFHRISDIFENLKNYLFKFKQEILKEDVNAILRRLSDHPDGKISFREFSVAITPNLVSLSNEALNNVEFGMKEK